MEHDVLHELKIKLNRIPLPFRLNHVNTWVIEEDGGCTVIDTGLNHPFSEEAWQAVLAERPIHRIIITHYHPDHYGYAGQLQAITDAEVWMSRRTEEISREVWSKARLYGLEKEYLACGLPRKLAQSLSEETIQFSRYVEPHPKVSRYIEEGEMIQLGGHIYQVLDVPGHAEGMLNFYNREKEVLIVADHILPKITPNISYHFVGDENPLKTYLRALEKVKAYPIGWALPSHGQLLTDVEQRIEEIIQHHHQRLQATLDAVQEPATVYEVNRKLFPQQLNLHELRFAIGETLAHLHYLLDQKKVERKEAGGVWRYVRI